MFFLRKKMMRKAMSTMRMTPTMQPITIPAMAPPDRPLLPCVVVVPLPAGVVIVDDDGRSVLVSAEKHNVVRQ